METEIELNPESPHNISDLSLGSSTRRKIVRKYFNWSIASYFLAQFITAILSLVAFAAALYIIVYGHIRGIGHTSWADVTVSVLLGLWTPTKIFSRKKVDKKN